jgi:hypothetical protein
MLKPAAATALLSNSLRGNDFMVDSKIHCCIIVFRYVEYPLVVRFKMEILLEITIKKGVIGKISFSWRTL